MQTVLVSKLLRVLGVSAVMFTASCGDSSELVGVSCPDLLRPLVVVAVRDVQGDPAAIGAALTVTGFTRSPFSIETIGTLDPLYLSSFQDGPAEDRIDVTVSKPSFKTVTVRDLQVPYDACGRGQVKLAITLEPVSS